MGYNSLGYKVKVFVSYTIKNAKVLIFMSLVYVIRNVMGLIKDVTSLRHEHPGKSSKNIGLVDVAKKMMIFKVCVSKQNHTLYNSIEDVSLVSKAAF